MDRREAIGVVGGLVAGVGEVLAHDGHQPAAAGGPLSGGHAHFCGIHVAKKDPKLQFITQHYCCAHGEELHQCLLFDSSGKNARLIGVEYIIPDAVYRKLADDEKKYWHPHTYEVLAGGLIAPGMKPDEEAKFMKFILTTWGKTWHTWPDLKSPLPTGEPLLVWSLGGDGQADEKLLAARDKEFSVSSAKIREQRCDALKCEVPQVSFPKSLDQPGRQWTDTGEDRPTSRR